MAINQTTLSFGKHQGSSVAEISYHGTILFTANEKYVDPNDFCYYIERDGNKSFHQVFTRKNKNKPIFYRWETEADTPRHEEIMITNARVELTIYEPNTENNDYVLKRLYKPTLEN